MFACTCYFTRYSLIDKANTHSLELSCSYFCRIWCCKTLVLPLSKFPLFLRRMSLHNPVILFLAKMVSLSKVRLLQIVMLLHDIKVLLWSGIGRASSIG